MNNPIINANRVRPNKRPGSYIYISPQSHNSISTIIISMSLQPSLSFLRIGDPTAPHALELYLGQLYTSSPSFRHSPNRVDFTCPFSAKIFFKAIDPILKPAFTIGNYKGKVKLILRLQPQPWQVQVQVILVM